MVKNSYLIEISKRGLKITGISCWLWATGIMLLPRGAALANQPSATTAAAAPTAALSGQGCSTCAEKTTLEKHKKEMARLRDLLVRNNSALSKTPKTDAVYQKFGSNILTLNILMETLTIKMNEIFSRCPGCKGGA